MPRITEMFAFVVSEKTPDDEGVIGHQIGNMMYPLVGADIGRVAALMPFAREFVAATKMEVRLLKFTNVEVLEVLAP